VEGDALILVEIRKGQAGIAKVILMKILRPIAGDAAAGVLRRQAAVGQVDGFQLAVAVLYAVAVERVVGMPPAFPLPLLLPTAYCQAAIRATPTANCQNCPALRHLRPVASYRMPRLPIWEGKLRKL
jgi:hypothetical protein